MLLRVLARAHEEVVEVVAGSALMTSPRRKQERFYGEDRSKKNSVYTEVRPSSNKENLAIRYHARKWIWGQLHSLSYDP